MERQRALEEERREKEKEPVKTIQSMGNAWKTQMILNQSKSHYEIRQMTNYRYQTLQNLSEF